jgi:hypothetical protein
MGKGPGGKPFTRAGMVEFDVYAWYVSQHLLLQRLKID